jgi:hypothetical protein
MEDDTNEDIEMARAIEASIQSYRQKMDEKSSEIVSSMLQEEEYQQMILRPQQQQQQESLQDSSDFSNRHQNHQQDNEDCEYAQALDQSLDQWEKNKLNNEMYNDAMNQVIERADESKTGCWDCTFCTFTNQPYHQKCAMCKASAPSHILTFQHIDCHHISFGIEIEIILPKGISDGFSLQSIAKNLTRLGPEPVRYDGYTHETTNHWKIVTDSSIRGNNQNQDLCFELVSPVLAGENGLASLRNVMSNVRSLGIATNSSCGFHVHVDATNDHTSIGCLEGLKRVAQHFVSMENAFDMLVARMGSSSSSSSSNGGGASDNGGHQQLLHGGPNASGSNRRANNNQYCRSNRILFGERSNRQRWNYISSVQTKNDLVGLVNPDHDRYRKLNLTNIAKHDRPSTIEFRQHGGVEDIQTAEAWVRLILSFCHFASQSQQECILHESSSPHDELQCLFGLVACEGLQQFFTIDRKLFVNHSLSNKWRCRRCRRQFQTSRSLSQHVEALGH